MINSLFKFLLALIFLFFSFKVVKFMLPVFEMSKDLLYVVIDFVSSWDWLLNYDGLKYVVILFISTYLFKFIIRLSRYLVKL